MHSRLRREASSAMMVRRWAGCGDTPQQLVEEFMYDDLGLDDFG